MKAGGSAIRSACIRRNGRPDDVADPGEKHDVAKEHPDQVAQLELLLNDYAKEAKPSLYFLEYLPFIVQDVKHAEMAYDGDEDSGQEDENTLLPFR